MFRTVRTLSVAVLLCGALGSSPAMAGGSVTIGVHPAAPQEAQALQAGLRLYALYRGVKSGSITQRGSGNAAGLAQNGTGNLGIVRQKGSGHTGTIEQNGDGNAYGLFQFGRNTTAHAAQHGDRRAGATFQFGW